MFLDEINTSSCMGLLKEVLVDRTFLGQVGVLQTGAFLCGSNSAYVLRYVLLYVCTYVRM